MPASEKKLTTSEAKSEFSRSPQLFNLRKKTARVCIFFFVAAVVEVVVDVEVVLFVVVVFVVVVVADVVVIVVVIFILPIVVVAVVVVAVVVIVVSVFFFNLNICQFKSLRAAPDLAEIEDATKRTKRRNNDFFFSTKKSREREQLIESSTRRQIPKNSSTRDDRHLLVAFLVSPLQLIEVSSTCRDIVLISTEICALKLPMARFRSWP